MTLLHRTTRRLDLTEEGAWLLGRARKVLADLEDTEAQVAARRSQPAGRVRVNAATPRSTTCSRRWWRSSSTPIR